MFVIDIVIVVALVVHNGQFIRHMEERGIFKLTGVMSVLIGVVARQSLMVCANLVHPVSRVK
jgi:hypothetical protein